MSKPIIDEEYVFDRATKRKYRLAGGDDSALGTIYASKDRFDEQPKRVRVRVDILE